MKNWENIHNDFADEEQKKDWEEAGFNYQQFKDWINLQLTPEHSVFAWWLTKEKNLTPESDLNIEKLEEEYFNWKQEWRKIDSEFSPAVIMRWKKRGFDIQKTKRWIDNYLEPKEHEFAFQLKENGITPEQYTNFKNKDAQEWLNYFYPKEKRDKVKKLNIREKKLINSLNLEGFSNLEELDCSKNNLNRLDVSDCPNLKKLYCFDNQLTDLNVSNLVNLQEVNCGNNNLINLNCSNCSQLEILDCSYNKLTKLILTNCLRITELQCYNNHLDNLDFLSGLGNEKLEIGNVSNNKINSNSLTPFAQFINLQDLNVGNNHSLSGSLEPLKYLDKLERLDVSDTDINSGVEYLPESIQYFNCSAYQPERKVKSIEEELAPYADTEESKYNFSKWRDENIVKIIPTLPPSLANEKGDKLAESYEIKEKYYDNKIYPESSFPQKVDESQILPLAELPTKLYNIKDNKLVKEKADVKNYAILSYVWGENNDKNKLLEEEKNRLDNVWKNSELGYENKVNRLGYKSWQKAIEACRHPSLNINHLWMDQLCINQSDNDEKEHEVPKMRQYYSNAVVTLIGIQAKAKVDEEELDLLDILKRITCSEWFTRSWTFQEGWLSKWTLFMFDDILVDGRQMAALWVFQQPSHIGIKFSKDEQGSKKVATPIGWVYYKGKDEKGYKSTDRVSLRLHEALREIKNRGRGNPIDGIYSILGLLPYGNKVEVSYKKRNCEQCRGEEKDDCQHDEKHKKWATYNSKELEERLLHVMQIALQNGYGEPLSWHGLGNGWLPQINDKGSTTIEGGIKIDYISQKDEKVIQADGSLKITGSEYVITKSSDTMSRWDQSSSIESGARERKVWIKDKNGEEKEIELSGTKQILSLMNKLVKEGKNNIYLLMPNKYQWRSNKPFAVLVEIEGNKYYGLGLVEISEGSDKLKEDEEEIIIWKKQNNWLNEEKSKKEELKAMIQRWNDELNNLQQQIAELPTNDQEELLAKIQIPFVQSVQEEAEMTAQIEENSNWKFSFADCLGKRK